MVDIDLRDFPFIPLYISRLQRSRAWLLCKREPALAFYMMNLWLRAWHEVPCGSLEDDDEVLADAAMCDVKTWLRVKERVLRGWKSEGGRLYHCVVTEVGKTSWESKQKQRQRTEAARQAKLQGRDRNTKPNVTESVTDNVTDDVTEHVTDDTTENVTEPVTASKGEGEGTIKESTPPTPQGDGGGRKRRRKIEDDPSFEAFWLAYPRRVAKGYARVAFQKALVKTTVEIIMATLKAHRFHSDPEKQPHPATWLNGERWSDDQLPLGSDDPSGYRITTLASTL